MSVLQLHRQRWRSGRLIGNWTATGIDNDLAKSRMWVALESIDPSRKRRPNFRSSCLEEVVVLVRRIRTVHVRSARVWRKMSILLQRNWRFFVVHVEPPQCCLEDGVMRAIAEVANASRSRNSVSTDCARMTSGKPRNTTVIQGALHGDRIEEGCDGYIDTEHFSCTGRKTLSTER